MDIYPLARAPATSVPSPIEALGPLARSPPWMTRLRPALLALLAPLLISCELVDYLPLVPAADVDTVREPLALTANGDHLWLADMPQPWPPGQDLRLVLADANDGSILLTLGPWTGEWSVVDVATEYETGSHDDIWVLHGNGWRTRWSPEGIMTGYERPVPDDIYPVIWRSYCGLARDIEHGYTFVATHELTTGGYQSVIYRHHEGEWERSPGDLTVCPEITYDLASDELVTYDNMSDTVAWWDPETLNVEHEFELETKYYDLVAFNRMIALSHYGRIDHYDENGVVLDTVADVHPEGLHVHYGGNMVRLFFSGSDDLQGGPGAFAVGSWELQTPEE